MAINRNLSILAQGASASGVLAVANGGSGVGATADPDGFGNFGVLNGTAVTNYLPEGGILVPLHGTLATGPKSFDAETTIQIVFNAPANAGGTGVLTVVVGYVFN
jgi:hypothetical protein